MVIGFCILAMLFAGGILVFLGRRQRGIFIFSPFGFFTIFFCLVYFFVPIVQALEPIGRFNYFFGKGGSYEILKALMISFGYYVAAFIAYLSVGPKTIDPVSLFEATRRDIIPTSVFYWVLLPVFFVSVFLTIRLLLPYLGDYAIFMYDRGNLLAGYGYVYRSTLIYISITIIIICDLFWTNSVRRRVILLGAALVVAGLGSVINLLLGSRTGALIGILYFGIVLIYLRRERIKLSKIARYAFLAVFTLYVFAIVGQLRAVVTAGGLQDVGGRLEELNLGIKDEVVSQLYKNFGHLELLAFIIEHKSEWDYAYGQTYAAAVLSPIPRALWENKPLGGGPMLTNIVAPGSYALGQKRGNSSLTTGVVIEAYLNFGFLGIIVGGFLHGFALGWLTKWGNRSRWRYQAVVYWLTLFFFCEMLLYSEVLGALIRYGLICFPIIGIVVFFRSFRGRR